MKTVIYTNIQLFQKATFPFLEKEEAFNNQMIGAILKTASSLAPISSDDCMLAVYDAEELVNVVFSTMGDLKIAGIVRKDAMEEIVYQLKKSSGTIDRIFAPNALADLFASIWNRDHSTSTKINLETRAMELKTMNKVDYAEGVVRIAVPNDEAIAIDLMSHFFAEALPFKKIKATFTQARVREMIKDQSLFLLENEGTCVSIAGIIRRLPHGCAIGYVYTPKPFRGKGYASKCVGRLCETVLAQGANFCALFADLDNPKARRLYRQLGFKPLGDFKEIAFSS